MDQKKPGWKALEVLKAVILDKWGRTEEADQMLSRLFTENNRDWQEETLQSLQFFYGERRDWCSLAQVYQQLWTQTMNSTLGETSVLYYIRAKDYSEAQKVASKLYRCYSSHYMAWWILSLLLQVRYEKADSRILMLAAKLGSKYIAESNSIPSSFIRLYIILLEQLGDYEQAKQIGRQYLDVSNDVLKKDHMEWLANLCYQSGQYEEALHYYEQLIGQQLENYHYWYMWMKCQIWNKKEESDCHSIQAEPFLRNLLEQIHELFSRALSNGNDTFQEEKKKEEEDCRTLQRRKRTLYMIQMETCREMIISWENKGLFMDCISRELFVIIQQYLNDMSSLPCCSTDLKAFVSLLKPNERNQLCQQIMETFASRSSSSLLSKESIFTTIEHFWLLLSLEPSSLPRIDTLLDYYIQWSKDHLVPFEHQYADGLILLIVNQLLSCDEHCRSPRYLLQAIQVLELGKHYSPYALELRLFLVIFYAFLGCYENAMEEWNAMELKHIQILTLSFLWGPFVHRWYDVNGMRWYHKKLSLFEKEHSEETPEGIFLAIRQQSYETVLDMIQFQYKVDHSEALLAFSIYSCHDTLFYHHRNSIRSLEGFSSDWLRLVGTSYRSLIRQWKEETCLLEDLYILDDHSVWNKSLGIMNAESWLDSDEMRVYRVRLDYVNLRLLLSFLLGEWKSLPNWSIVYFESAILSKEDDKEYYGMVEYWYSFWQYLSALYDEEEKTFTKDTENTSQLYDLYQQWYSKWQQYVPWNDERKKETFHAVEYFPFQFPRWIYYVHQIGLYESNNIRPFYIVG
ncbi:uncharacterized protein Gasu_31240 [Galdieria sulphuraria]|uniref:Uncharacterized protein n=1 Tax=Galdieria sulphuraria TaxID=130081 RepID=M2Y0N4_GALSU|nr:uncharacterized protein Gasu_31240 [Galdieria sulphuraria]EME29483.1 hypothetical protein Gasu_31240 [Galdieria sulphuraria]|eukprot:XP_005706003.1 hypothetical protein Gasu_31240 [Galdieria sulphuraria]